MATTNLDHHNHHYHLPSSVGSHYFNTYHPVNSNLNHHHNNTNKTYYNQEHNLIQSNCFSSQQSSIEASEANYAPEEMKQQPHFERQLSQAAPMIDRFIQYRPIADSGSTGAINQHATGVGNVEPLQLAANAISRQAYWTANSSPKSSADSAQSAITNQASRGIQPVYGKGVAEGAGIPGSTASQQQEHHQQLQQQQLQCLDSELTPLVKIS